jgi:RNA polymerase sigma factor (sigma-70 family)
MQENKCRSTSPPNDSPIAQWYQLHAIPLLAYIRQHVPSREDAEDIVVETFIAALEQKGFSPYALTEQEQLAWLRRVAYHKCIDLYRRSARRPAVPMEETAEILFEDERLSPDQVALRNEDNEMLHLWLSQLPEHYQTVVRLRFANNMRSTEISRLLNKSEGAIRVILSRALNTLRDLYTKQSEKNSHETR